MKKLLLLFFMSLHTFAFTATALDEVLYALDQLDIKNTRNSIQNIDDELSILINAFIILGKNATNILSNMSKTGEYQAFVKGDDLMVINTVNGAIFKWDEKSSEWINFAKNIEKDFLSETYVYLKKDLSNDNVNIKPGRKGPNPDFSHNIEIGNSVVLGNPNAKVTVTKFTDFQ